MDTTIAVTLDDPAAAYEGLTRLGERDVQRRLRSAGQLLVPDEIHGPGPAGSKALIGGGAGLLLVILGGPVGVALGGMADVALDLSPQDEPKGLLAACATCPLASRLCRLRSTRPPRAVVDASMAQLDGAIVCSTAAAVSAEMKAPVQRAGSGDR